ncbi:MAG: hypothetical protein QOH67_2936 [Hyphomicrobiales bacterium]|nr:hypothetical protein [Hyphomicrobiales bacterium]
MAKSPTRPGLPAPSSVVERIVLVPQRTAPALARISAAAPGAAASAAAPAYMILRTNEVDPYDVPMPRSAVPPIGAPAAAAPAAAKPAPVGDKFGGTDRKAAKLSTGNGAIEVFADVAELIKTLPSKAAMKKHKPKIGTDAGSGRVTEEQRDVRVRGFIYAASREGDNDFHVMLGRDPAKKPMYFNMEISGLPPAGAKSLARIKKVRDDYKTFFTTPHVPKLKLPGMSYDFYDPPIPVEVEGSLFFDMTHASGAGPGPQSLHKDIPTIWEIHPVTKITFEP